YDVLKQIVDVRAVGTGEFRSDFRAGVEELVAHRAGPAEDFAAVLRISGFDEVRREPLFHRGDIRLLIGRAGKFAAMLVECAVDVWILERAQLADERRGVIAARHTLVLERGNQLARP